MKTQNIILLLVACFMCMNADPCDAFTGSWFGEEHYSTGATFPITAQTIKQVGDTHVQMTLYPNPLILIGTCAAGKIEVKQGDAWYLAGGIFGTQINLAGYFPGTNVTISLYKSGSN